MTSEPASETFRALVIDDERRENRAEIAQRNERFLMEGEVLVAVSHSSLNYKDALAITGRGRILRRSPLIGGIDLAGHVLASQSPIFREGDAVLATGCGLGEAHHGGFATRARLPAEWLIPIPAGLDARTAMALGTAGFTVALAIKRFEDNGQTPAHGPMIVTGATGGVGSIAIDVLAGLGYEVVALSGKPELEGWLKGLGAAQVVDRNTLEMGTRPLEAAQWGGALDNVGGATLAWLTRTVRPWGNIAAIGMAGGTELDTSVMPFILRGIGLLGISSANCPPGWRH
ncbi:MAG: acryloyl-CoA reductase, partial [Chromatiales bacterium]|nr:acryloyl-CoA reductase [Chromatiales bacterium]